MVGVWDQEQKIVSSEFGTFDLVCLWTKCQEPDVEMPDYELEQVLFSSSEEPIYIDRSS